MPYEVLKDPVNILPLLLLLLYTGFIVCQLAILIFIPRVNLDFSLCTCVATFSSVAIFRSVHNREGRVLKTFVCLY